MKIFEVIGTPDTVAAGSDYEAISFYERYQEREYGIGSKVKVKEIKGEDLKKHKVWDEDGVVSEYPRLVSYDKMKKAEEAEWDGSPYIFTSIEY